MGKKNIPAKRQPPHRSNLGPREKGLTFAEQITASMGIKPDEAAVVEPIHYPENFSTPEGRITHNAHIIGTSYEHQSQIDGLSNAFTQTFGEVAQDISQELAHTPDKESTQNKRETLRNALSELELLTTVERIVFEGDLDHIDAQTFNEGVSVDGDPQFIADINGVTTSLLVKGEPQKVYVKTASWTFNPNGIRLEIKYISELDGTEYVTNANMDFHRRKHERFGNKEQAALDLNAGNINNALGYLTRPAGTSEEDFHRKKDYHRYKHLDACIKGKDDFETIKEARIKNMRALKDRASQLAKQRHSLAGIT